MKTFKKGQSVIAEGYAYTIIEYVAEGNRYLMEEVGTGHIFQIDADANIQVAP